jgi:hypothetical protein
MSAPELELGRRTRPAVYQPAEELFLGEQVQAVICLPRDNSLASWYKLVQARQGIIAWQAGTGFNLLGEQ